MEGGREGKRERKEEPIELLHIFGKVPKSPYKAELFLG
jgi:hypothetical protein